MTKSAERRIRRLQHISGLFLLSGKESSVIMKQIAWNETNIFIIGVRVYIFKTVKQTRKSTSRICLICPSACRFDETRFLVCKVKKSIFLKGAVRLGEMLGNAFPNMQI